MSQIVIRESTDFDQTSSDEELREMNYFKNFKRFAKKMLQNGTPLDHRLINHYQIRKASQNGNKEP